MSGRRAILAGAVVAATFTLVTACGASDEKHPTPTIGDPAVLERPGDTTATTNTP